MKVSDLDFHLSESLIALEPVNPRDKCRLLVLHRSGTVEHRQFFELPEYLSKGDLLVLNNTRVFPARLAGKKQTGGKIQILLTKRIEHDTWEILSRDKYTGKVYLSDKLSGEIADGKTVRFVSNEDPRANSDITETFWKIGQMPLPPYIKRIPCEADKQWYQTVYAEKACSIAAPTAGLHFSRELINTLEEKGVILRFITLHIGRGTFKQVKTENAKDHIMDAERFEIEASLIDTIREVKRSGKKVFSVGTTTTRALEGYASGKYHNIAGTLRDGDEETSPGPRVPEPPYHSGICGSTNIFIYPDYEFKVIDSLITNFHLPRSTPLMLTSALTGVKNIMDAYRSAISMKYRFFSYGDAMLIL